MKISRKTSLLVAYKCTKIPQWDLKFQLNKSESLTKAFWWTQSLESSGMSLKTKMPKENGLFVFQNDTEPFQAELAFFGLFFHFFSLDMLIRHLQTTALQNLFKYVWKTAQESRTFSTGTRTWFMIKQLQKNPEQPIWTCWKNTQW